MKLLNKHERKSLSIAKNALMSQVKQWNGNLKYYKHLTLTPKMEKHIQSINRRVNRYLLAIKDIEKIKNVIN